MNNRRHRALLIALLCLTLGACNAKPPVSVTVTESMVGQGLVLTVTNTSDEFLHDVAVSIESPAGELKKFFSASLAPHDAVKVGWLKLDGWPIPEGSEVEVSAKGYVLPAGPWKATAAPAG